MTLFEVSIVEWTFIIPMSSRKQKGTPKAGGSRTEDGRELTPSEEKQKIEQMKARLKSMERCDTIAWVLFFLFLLITFGGACYYYDWVNKGFIENS